MGFLHLTTDAPLAAAAQTCRMQRWAGLVAAKPPFRDGRAAWQCGGQGFESPQLSP